MERPKGHSPGAIHELKIQLSILTVVFGLGVWAIVSHLRDLQIDLIESSTIRSASQYSETLTQFRTLYTSEVVERLASEGIEVTHDYHQKQGAIPLPATLSMLLGERIGSAGKDFSVKLYSGYPFPWRSEGGLHDEFAKHAWGHFTSGEAKPYIRIEAVNGVLSVRYAVADVMRPSCVGCHNSHSQSPKRDWRVNDVRGVLEVIQPIDAGIAQADRIFREIVVLSVVLLVITFGAIGLIIRRLQIQKQHTESVNQALNHEISERKLAQEQAVSAKEEAIAANQAKSIFLANITHEIRTPMNAILGYAQILQRDGDLTEDQKESVQIINRSGGHLLGLINDVLELSRIEAGAHEIKPTAFDLVELLNDLREMFLLRTQQKGLDWQVESDFPTVRLLVLGDVGKLRQVLINLVGNSIKFTDTGFVRLSVTTVKDDHYHFDVVDSGPGISKEQQITILEPFTQGSIGHEKGGTGLGLAISNKYLKLMDSTLKLTSQLEEGTRVSFTVELPLSEAPELAPDNLKQVVKLQPQYHIQILVVDDIELNRQLLHRMLTDIGASVITAKDGESAIDVLRSSKVDLIFTDLCMPDMDGVALLKEIKGMPEYAKVPLVAISASSLQVDLHHYLKLGFDDYISKPFYFESIYQCLQRHLNVDFLYKATDMSDVSDKAELPVSKISQQMKAALIAAAELYQISELEELIRPLDKYQSPWIEQVRDCISSYDMDGLIRYLNDMESDDE